MGDLLQPWHILVILGIMAVIAFIAVKNRQAKTTPTRPQGQSPAIDPALPELKFCSECGQQIKRRSEICPLCGCRQSADRLEKATPAIPAPIPSDVWRTNSGKPIRMAILEPPEDGSMDNLTGEELKTAIRNQIFKADRR